MLRKTGNRRAEATEADRLDSALAKLSAEAPPRQSRWQPAILSNTAQSNERFAECAGRTTAGCLAICCCIPCGLLNLLILAAVRLPAGLCCRCIRKRVSLQQSKKKAAILGPGSGNDGSVKASSSVENECDLVEFAGLKMVKVDEDSRPTRSPAAEVVEMEEAVWSKFHNSGFWRTPSQGEDR